MSDNQNSYSLEAGNLITDVTKKITGPPSLDEIKQLISSYDVMFFSKSTCAYCLELKRTLKSYGVHFTVFEMDACGDFDGYRFKLGELTKSNTAPQLFLKGQYIGGCDKIKDMDFKGDFYPIIAPYMTADRNPGSPVQRFGFFYVPEMINSHAVRVGGNLMMIISILCIVFLFNPVTPYVALFEAIEYTVRLIWGGQAGFVSMVANLLVSTKTPKLSAGLPKQFAVLCGVSMTIPAAGLWLGGQPIAAAVVMGVLMTFQALEGVFDWCMGCFIFGNLIKFGLVPPSVYQPYLSFRPIRNWAVGYLEENEKIVNPEAKQDRFWIPGQSHNTPVDLVRKVRNETEYKLADFHLIKHVKIEFFACPMALAVLAYAFRVCHTINGQPYLNVIYIVLAITSAVFGCFIGLLYLLRLAKYTSKVTKEWSHPVTGNFFSMITILLGLWGVLLVPQGSSSMGESDDNLNFAGVLIWAGAVGQLAHTYARLQSLIFDRVAEEFINPAIMGPPVGNFLSALGLMAYGSVSTVARDTSVNYLSTARLWFSVAMLYSIVFFTITLRKAFHDHNSDTRLRPLLYMYLATPSVAGPAYLAVCGLPNQGTELVFQSLWFIAVHFFVVLGTGWLRNWFTYQPVADFGIFITPFAFSTFAISTCMYYGYSPNQLFKALMIISMVLATYSTAVCLVHALLWFKNKTAFLPKSKWSPLTFLKITHDCFRFAIPKYMKQLEGATPENKVALDLLVQNLMDLFLMFMEHAKHEDEVLYPFIRRNFPNMNENIAIAHHHGHEQFHEIEALVKTYSESKGDPEQAKVFLDKIKVLFPQWAEDLLVHLRNEENTLSVAARKYVGVELTCEIIKKCWDITGISEWRKVMPFVVEHLPLPAWKLRYVRTILWTVPSRAHEIGLCLYHGCDSVTWQFLIQEMPELIPRGLPGYKKIY